MPISDYSRMHSLENLKRAYRWILSNPDANYKHFFRDAYLAYAASSDLNLRRLKKSIAKNTYHSEHASKIFLPKASGLVRPYSLLTVNDQIVFQACVNIIAEKFPATVRGRYLKTVFGHLYAGRKSKFFYLKWQNGYQAYSKKTVSLINQGYNYVANFDFASFYDSIDHHVLKTFLTELGIDNDLSEFLMACLRTWTSTTWMNRSSIIYHGHGIPQGPLSSGLLAEVVLKHMDDRGIRAGKVQYLRYVDDIKIFGKSEEVLRQRLVALDLHSKDIGLFPQTAKINIREVFDPLDEIKTISRPPEPSVGKTINQELLRKRLLELTKGNKISPDNATRFKYLLARAEPHNSINKRVTNLFSRCPEFSSDISAYYNRNKKMSRKIGQQIIGFLTGPEIYHVVFSQLLIALLENLKEEQKQIVSQFCYERLVKPKKGQPPPQPTYRAALFAWVLRYNKLTYDEANTLIRTEKDWWVKKDLIKYLRTDQFGKPSYEMMLNQLIRSKEPEPARLAAMTIIDDQLDVKTMTGKIHEAARVLLFEAGKIRRIGAAESSIATILEYVLSAALPAFDWKKFFGTKHARAEYIAFSIRQSFEADINGCILTLDSFADLVFETLFYKELTGYKYGKYGNMLKHPTLTSKYPSTTGSFTSLHQLRLESVTAHPRNEKTGKATRRLKHKDFSHIKPAFVSALKEIIHNNPV